MTHKTPIEHVIEVLEASRKERLTKGLETPSQGFSMAISIVRALSKVIGVNDKGDRFLEAFEEYVVTHKHHKTYNIIKCSRCGGSHGETPMLLIQGESDRYWYICSAFLSPAFYKVEG